MRGEVCEVVYERWVMQGMQGRLCEVGYVRWVTRVT